MIFCINCGKQVDETVKFCPYCGADIRKAKTDSNDLPSAEFVIAKNAEAAEKRNVRKKKDNKAIIITAIIAAVCVLAFLLYIGPKFLGVQFLPIDPFGVMDENSSARTADSDRADEEDDEEIYEDGIDSIILHVGELGEIKVLSKDEYPLQEFTIQVGDVIDLYATINPDEAKYKAETKWTIINQEVGFFDTKRNFQAAFSASAPGATTVEYRAYTDNKNQRDALVATFIFNVIEQEPEDLLWPFKGVVFRTNEEKLGIFIRSDPTVTGAGNKLNDGNKIGWIAGGDTSVTLVATGKEYHEGGNLHWWYEVEIPQWYRDTAKQSENYSGKPLIGWVRDDVVYHVPQN